ncbi:MAG TPA: TIGR04141 family sporadically distributed protein [Thermoanaerobaculia bacterium]|jgi:uncharacterized protein (TIGR04141 family)|nr:TIGR04141 family sporadically distributed protein [Thermoanaerobaculia bacterium]
MAIRGLTIYLLKDSITDPASAVNFEAATDIENISGPGIGPWTLVIRRGEDRYPDWAFFFEGLIDLAAIGKTHSVGALLFVPAAGRWFALAFGTGRYLLLPSTYEERFGLRVALNSVDEDKLRSIDKKTFEAVSLHAREQASEDSGASAFGLDIERDLLRAVTGTPANAELGKRLAGMDSLKAHIEVDLPALAKTLERYYIQYLDESYRKKFPWVDHISEVTDKSVIEELEALVVARLRAQDFKGCWLACPEIVDWAEVSGFRFGQSRNHDEYYDIHLRHFMASVSSPTDVDRDMLKRRRVFCIRDDGRPMKDWSVHECLNCEVDYKGSAFLLSNGNWYRIAESFVEGVNKFVEAIPRFTMSLPAFDDKNEAAYNTRVAESDSDTFALMDRKEIRYGGGPSKLEFCDLFTRDRDLIHVKQYGGSSLLSHLFAQGLNSADLFLGEADFRKIVHDKLPDSHRCFNPLERPHPEEYQVVFGIISQSQGDLWIPFFSRLSLRHACKRLQTLGYRVALAKIDVARRVVVNSRRRGPARKTF